MLAVALALGGTEPALAIELSHYAGGLPNVDDFFLPPPEVGQFIYAQYGMWYTTDTLNDHHGNKIHSVTGTGPLGIPITAQVDVNLDMYFLAPSFMWAPTWNVLGGRYGAYIVVPVGNPSLEADLNTKLGSGRFALTR